VNNEKTEWEKIEPVNVDTWKPEQAGDSIIGVFVDIKPKDDNRELSARYFIDTKEGQKMVWGSVALDDRMRLANIGELIQITYNGKKKISGGREVKLFAVQRARQTKEPTPASIPPVAPTPTPPPAQDVPDLIK
jgi:hypothetical protein